MAGPSILTRFLADTSDLTNKVNTASSGAENRLSSFAKKAAITLGGAFAATKIVDFGRQAVSAASDMEESVSKVGVVFGSSAGDVEKWASNAAESMGLSNQAALEAVGTYGNLATSMGIPQQASADMSKSLVELASDLASFNNMTVDEALQALQSGLTGETEPLKKFGINLNEAALKAKAMEMGLSDGKSTLTASAKAQAAYALMVEQSSNAQGDFARTSDGLANQQKIAAAKVEDLKAALGAKLLPVVLKVTTVFADTLLPAIEGVFNWISDNKEIVVSALIGFGTVVLATLVPAFIAWAGAAAAAAAATLVAIAPFVLIGAAIGALAYLIIHNWDTIVAATKAAWDAVLAAIRWVWDWVKENWPLLLTIITGPIGAAVAIVIKHWDTIKDAATAVWQWVVDKWNAIVDGIMAAVHKVGEWMTKLGEFFTRAKDAATSVWQWIKDKWDAIVSAISGAVDRIRGFMDNAVEYIKRPIAAATEVYNWVKDKFDALADAISNVIGRVRSAIGDIVDAIKSPINGVIRAWNRLEFRVPTISLPKVHIPGTDIDVGGGKFGGFTIGFPDIPQLARGGVLTSPTLFVGGEAGREIVAPEALLRQIIAEESGGASYTLNMYPRTADAADVAYGFKRLEMLSGATV